jgi:RimJ/RimL family protein N-acetyltransferase
VLTLSSTGPRTRQSDDLASWRVLEKLGMRREQHGIRDSRHAELGWIDGFTYAMLEEEWRAIDDMVARSE